MASGRDGPVTEHLGWNVGLAVRQLAEPRRYRYGMGRDVPRMVPRRVECCALGHACGG